VRAVRLALEEKGVEYELVPVDIFAPGGPPPEHMARHPFGKIPAFEHAGFRLYEAGAITRYVDEAFAGPPLQPLDPRSRARMNQIISILDSYAYRTLVWDIYVERIVRPTTGSTTDEARVTAAMPKAEICLFTLAELMGESSWLAGPVISLADLMRLRYWRPSDLRPRASVFSIARIVSPGGGIASAHARALRGPASRRATRHHRFSAADTLPAHRGSSASLGFNPVRIGQSHGARCITTKKTGIDFR